MPDYDPNFLGVNLPLPAFTPARVADILKSSDLAQHTLATYQNYSVVTDKRYRAPAFVVSHIDQGKFQKTTRSDRWQIDSRVGQAWQLDNAYYQNNPWDKGHMADRETAAWGETPRDAQISADETFYYANACLQHKNLNQDEWLALEQWIMRLEVVKNKKLTVFTGPVFGDTPRIVTPIGRPSAIVPVAFFKVICFVNRTSGLLDVRAFLIYQDNEALKDILGRKTFNYTKYQVTITEIEKVTGIRFDYRVYDANPLLFRPNRTAGRKLNVWSFPERIDINSPNDIIHPGQTRVHVADDEIEVYIVAALVKPSAGAKEEWVAIANYKGKAVKVDGWKLSDRAEHTVTLKGTIPAGETLVLQGAKLRPVGLPDTAGVLTLLNAAGDRVDRVDYTEDDVKATYQKKPRENLPINFLTYRSELRPG
ncbi:MAG: DNA/RNA non-specific endonuclease [Opitutaceae bacterium]